MRNAERFTTMNEVYQHFAYCLMNEGQELKVRDLWTRELTNVQFELTNQRYRYVSQTSRKLDWHYLIGELCYYLSGSNQLSPIVHYSKFWNKVSDDGLTVNSAYGYRLFKQENKDCRHQLDYVIDTLRHDRASRKAVMPIYDKDDAKVSNDNPCTMFMQFLIRRNRLECYTFMRSNDIWLGVPYDVAFFALVQEIVYCALRLVYSNLQLGSYFHHATSLHIYANHFDALNKIYNEPLSEPITAPALCYDDIQHWFSDLLLFENTSRTTQLYAQMFTKTPFQTWCKTLL